MPTWVAPSAAPPERTNAVVMQGDQPPGFEVLEDAVDAGASPADQLGEHLLAELHRPAFGLADEH